MEKNDGGIGNWPVLLLILSFIGAAATQVSPRAAPPAQGQAAAVGVAPGTAQASSGAAALLATLVGLSAPAPDASSESLRELVARAREAAALRKISVEFLVATLPDYVDSNSGWSFDARLDAVQRAAGAAGFVIDRFVLPDWAPTADGTDPATGRQHEVEPGLVLFRKVDVAEATKILAVFIATETPTAGIHEAAFLKAAGIASAWQELGDESEDRVLRVLGPTFSGSSPSLRRAITTFLDNAAGRLNTVRVLSGTATSRANQQLLTFAWPEPGDAMAVEVGFSATVRTDDVMLHMLHDHLVEINPQWQDGAGIVLLVESNTGYGQGFASQDDGERAGRSATARFAESDPFSRALRIPFPIHISRLRAEADRLRGVDARRGGTGLGSTLRDISPATDQLPSMTPEITATAIDTLVASILATIRREEYQAIGIFATDKRDHLFLAERIVREVPNALLFTTEADLLYIHPDFRSFVRGAIVATTYPLFNATQSLTSPHLASLGRQQFSTMAAHGTYNAVLKLLERDDLLLDYVSPGCLAPDADGRGGVSLLRSPLCKRPSVWLSMVGRDGLWPIDYHPDEDPTDSYTEAINIKEEQLNHLASAADQSGGPAGKASRAHHTNESGSAHALLHVAAWMKAAFVLLLLALVVHGVKYVAEVSPESRWLKIRGLRRFLHVGGIDEPSLVAEHRLYLLIAFAILWFASVWAILLFRIWTDNSPIVISEEVVHAESGTGYVNIWIWYLVYGVVLGLVVVESTLTLRHRRLVVPKGWGAGAIVTLTALILAFCAGLNLAGFLGSREWSDPVGKRLLFARTVSPGNWASPAAPVLALLGVLYLWTQWNARQLRLGGWKIRRNSQLFQLLTGYEPRLTDEVAEIMVSPWRRQDWRCLAIPFGLLLTFWLYVPTWYTPDGRHFDRFLWWGSLLTMFLIAHSLAMTVHLWLLIRRILWHLHGHPISDSFKRVAEEPFNWQLSLTPPLAIELKPLARKARGLRFALRQVIGESDRVNGSAVPVPNVKERRGSAYLVAPISKVEIGSDATDAAIEPPNTLVVTGRQVLHVPETVRDVTAAVAPPRVERRRTDASLPMRIEDVEIGSDAADVTTAAAGALMVRRQELTPVVDILDIEFPDALDAETEKGSIQPYFRSETWSALVILSDRLVPVLRHGFWHRGSATPRPASELWYRNAEALVGMQAAFVLRDMLARLVSGMTVTIIGAVLALASHLFYSFPGRSAMLAFDWIMVALAVTAAAAMLIYLEKNPVLNRLWSKAPGRLIWSGGFVYRLGLYGAIPIITLFAWQFPEVGGRLFGWIEPLQKAIP